VSGDGASQASDRRPSLAKWIAMVLGVLLIATNGFWLYSAVDLAVTQKYRQQEVYEANHRIEALGLLCDKLVGGMAKAEATQLLRDLSPGFEPYEKEGHINTIWLSLRLNEQGRVSAKGACQ
jgi:hypothetical protein